MPRNNDGNAAYAAGADYFEALKQRAAAKRTEQERWGRNGGGDTTAATKKDQDPLSPGRLSRTSSRRATISVTAVASTPTRKNVENSAAYGHNATARRHRNSLATTTKTPPSVGRTTRSQSKQMSEEILSFYDGAASTTESAEPDDASVNTDTAIATPSRATTKRTTPSKKRPTPTAVASSAKKNTPLKAIHEDKEHDVSMLSDSDEALPSPPKKQRTQDKGKAARGVQESKPFPSPSVTAPAPSASFSKPMPLQPIVVTAPAPPAVVPKSLPHEPPVVTAPASSATVSKPLPQPPAVTAPAPSAAVPKPFVGLALQSAGTPDVNPTQNTQQVEVSHPPEPSSGLATHQPTMVTLPSGAAYRRHVLLVPPPTKSNYHSMRVGNQTRRSYVVVSAIPQDVSTMNNAPQITIAARPNVVPPPPRFTSHANDARASSFLNSSVMRSVPLLRPTDSVAPAIFCQEDASKKTPAPGFTHSINNNNGASSRLSTLSAYVKENIDPGLDAIASKVSYDSEQEGNNEEVANITTAVVEFDVLDTRVPKRVCGISQLSKRILATVACFIALYGGTLAGFYLLSHHGRRVESSIGDTDIAIIAPIEEHVAVEKREDVVPIFPPLVHTDISVIVPVDKQIAVKELEDIFPISPPLGDADISVTVPVEEHVAVKKPDDAVPISLLLLPYYCHGLYCNVNHKMTGIQTSSANTKIKGIVQLLEKWSRLQQCTTTGNPYTVSVEAGRPIFRYNDLATALRTHVNDDNDDDGENWMEAAIRNRPEIVEVPVTGNGALEIAWVHGNSLQLCNDVNV